MGDNSKGICFEGKHFYVGIDVHKRHWVVTIRQEGMELRTFSQDPRPEVLKKHLEKTYPGGTYHVVYEAGFSGFWACRWFREQGIDCVVVNPADVPTGQKEKDRKRDSVDSRKLARELYKGELEGIYVPDEEAQHLRSLCRLYSATVKDSTRMMNRIKGHLHFNGVFLSRSSSNWSKGFISSLRELPLDGGPGREYLHLCLDDLDRIRQRKVVILKQLREYVRDHAAGRIIGYLKTIPGIAFRTAITLFTEIISMDRFSNADQLKAYFGLVPSSGDSGEKTPEKGMTARKNGFLRHLIIEAAWVAVRKDPAMLAAYNALRSRMKTQDAIIRIAVKLLRRIRYVWQHQCPYVTSMA